MCLNNWVCLLLHRESWVSRDISLNLLPSYSCSYSFSEVIFFSFPPTSKDVSLPLYIDMFWIPSLPISSGCHQSSIIISAFPSILVSYPQTNRKCSHHSLLSTNTTFFTFIKCWWPCKFIKIKITIIKIQQSFLQYIAKSLRYLVIPLREFIMDVFKDIITKKIPLVLFITLKNCKAIMSTNKKNCLSKVWYRYIRKH